MTRSRRANPLDGHVAIYKQDIPGPAYNGSRDPPTIAEETPIAYPVR